MKQRTVARGGNGGSGVALSDTSKRAARIMPLSDESLSIFIKLSDGSTRQYSKEQAGQLAIDIRTGSISHQELEDNLAIIENWPPLKGNHDLFDAVDYFKKTGDTQSAPNVLALYPDGLSGRYQELGSDEYNAIRKNKERMETSKKVREVTPLECAAAFAAAPFTIFKTIWRRARLARVLVTPHPVSKRDMGEHISSTKEVVRSSPRRKRGVKQHLEDFAAEVLDRLFTIPFNSPRDEVGKFKRALEEGRANEVFDDGEGRVVEGYVDNVRLLNQLMICSGIDVSRKKHHTIRVPNPVLEKGPYVAYLQKIIETNFEQLQKDDNDFGEWRGRLAIYEVIVPQINCMEDLQVLKDIQEDIRAYVAELLEQKREAGVVFDHERYSDSLCRIRLIPLVEDANLVLNLSEFIQRYKGEGLCVSTRIPKLPTDVFEYHVSKGNMRDWLLGVWAERTKSLAFQDYNKLNAAERLNAMSSSAYRERYPELELLKILETWPVDYHKISELYYRVQQQIAWYKARIARDPNDLDARDCYASVIVDREYDHRFKFTTEQYPEGLPRQGVRLSIRNIEELLELIKDNDRVIRVMVAGSDIPLRSGILKARTCELLAGDECCKAQKRLDREARESGEEEIFATLIAGRGDNAFRGRATPATPRAHAHRGVSDALLELLPWYTGITLQGVIEDQSDVHLLRPFVSDLKVLPMFYDLLPDYLKLDSGMFVGQGAYERVKEHGQHFVLPDMDDEETGFLTKEEVATAKRILTMGEIAYLQKLPHVVGVANALNKMPKLRPRRKTYSRDEPGLNLTHTPTDLVDQHTSAFNYCNRNWPFKKDTFMSLCNELRGLVPAGSEELLEQVDSLVSLAECGRWADVREKIDRVRELSSTLGERENGELTTTLEKFQDPDLLVSLPRPITFNGILLRLFMPPSLLDLDVLVDICERPDSPEKRFIDNHMPGLFEYAMFDEPFFMRRYALLMFDQTLVNQVQESINRAIETNDLRTDQRVETYTRAELELKAINSIFTAKLLVQGEEVKFDGNITLFNAELLNWAINNHFMRELAAIYFDAPDKQEALAAWLPESREPDELRSEFISKLEELAADGAHIRGPKGIMLLKIESIPKIAWLQQTLG